MNIMWEIYSAIGLLKYAKNEALREQAFTHSSYDQTTTQIMLRQCRIKQQIAISLILAHQDPPKSFKAIRFSYYRMIKTNL